MWKSCSICPRECGADRSIPGEEGYCGAPEKILVARAALHAWEEPCVSGMAGSGAVFFSGCSLGCIYCQNEEISLRRRPLPGIEVSTEALAGIFLRLQEEKGANNINLVTAAHYIPSVAEAITLAKNRGLRIPVIYNSGGYEKVSSLVMLDGLVDVYLPDFKYMNPETAREYSHAADYPETAKAALKEMVRQTGEPSFYPEKDQDPDDGEWLIKRGVIVRHMLLPGHVTEAKEIISYLHRTYGNRIYISILNQYTPMPQVCGHPLLGRKTTAREYRRLVDYAVGIGVELGYVQEGENRSKDFIPPWDGEGVLYTG